MNVEGTYPCDIFVVACAEVGEHFDNASITLGCGDGEALDIHMAVIGFILFEYLNHEVFEEVDDLLIVSGLCILFKERVINIDIVINQFEGV